MFKSFPNSRELPLSPRGFTLIELLVAMTLSLLLLGIAFNIFDKLNNAADVVGTMADVNENLRAATNMIARDVSTAGAEIPLGGIPLPAGGAACQPIQLPLPSSTLNSVSPAVFTLPAQYFNNAGTPAVPACPAAGSGININVITPGSGYGPTSDNPAVGATNSAIPTDSITLTTVNAASQLGQFQLSSIVPVTTAGKACCFPAGTTSVTITVNPSTNGGSPINIAGPNWVQVVPGQLIMLTNTYGSILLAVSSVTATTITFTSGDTTNDPLPFNQFPLNANSPTSGTIGQLETLGTGTPPAANVYPPTYAYQVTMTTYYLDNATRAPYWMLMKLIGTGAPMTGTPAVQSNPPTPVAMGINVLQFSFSLSPPAEPTDPTRTFVAPYTPNTIRKVNLWMIAQADHKNRKTGTYFTNSVATSVTAQNLAYYNQY
jgi:prepilin-type N-terminal cleavage/methylation domain-containing protein